MSFELQWLILVKPQACIDQACDISQLNATSSTNTETQYKSSFPKNI